MTLKIVIIGGEAAGMSAAAKARRMCQDAEIIVYEASDIISFGACGLPYYIADEFQDARFMAEFTPEQFIQKGINVKTGHQVIAVDTETKSLTIKQGENQFTTHYDRLMIATGATETVPPIDNVQVKGVYTLRRMADGLTLKSAIAEQSCRNITVVGSGFIGLELVDALVKQGKQVRLIELADRVIPDAFDAEISELIEVKLRDKGVELHLGEQVTGIIGDHHVTGIKTNKNTYQTDMVVICTGVRPNTAFIKQTGIAMLGNGAIKVDRRGRTSIDDIYAAGDCASVWHQLKQQDVYLPLATIANKLGRIVGENLAGSNSEFPGTLGSAMVKVLGLEIARTGLSENEAKKINVPYKSMIVKDKNHTNYCHGQADVYIKIVYEPDNKRLLGAQIIGGEGAALRLHTLSLAITLKMTTQQLSLIDFAYAPPFNRPWEILNVVGNVAR